jgi:hypothetical protein
MSQRITVMLDDYNDNKLPDFQAKLIKEFNKSNSFSTVIGDILPESLEIT